jgi:hypothetical protein
MWRFRPVTEAGPVLDMFALYFLQEDYIGCDRPYRIAQLVQDEFTIEEGEALVGIHRQYAERKVRERAR